ncbi:MAG: PASTA domain-containing protein [Firmicutes bacterium]|nr:PASTA domain-containing protein [Bacillota bacterium]
MTFVMLAALLFFVAVIIKLFVLQFIQGEELQRRAELMRTRDLTVSAARGTIYDCNGTKLALSITAESVGVYTKVIRESEDPNATAADVASSLSGLLNVNYQDVLNKVKSDTSFVWIQRKVDFELAEQIRELELPGVALVEETERYYPLGTLAAHVLGFAGVDNQGLEGMEASLDEELSGTDGSITGMYDANETAIPQADYEYVPPHNGCDIYSTIDENIQYFCERELTKLMTSETPPKRAGIIVMDPHTGAIKAMAASDPFDPNKWEDYDSKAYRNWLISDSYEPGSVFKIITAATALEENTVNLNSTFDDPGYITVADATIHCWGAAHGLQTLGEAVSNSCNPAFVEIGQTIEYKQSGLLYKYIDAFGFGKTTNVDLPGEAVGILQAEDNRGPVELATSAIGQGIGVTPIQMITAVCAVANGGDLLKPQIVSKIVDDGETIYELKPEVVRKVISEQTAATLRQLLVGVVLEGSGSKAAIEGYTIAGKTGTAQKAENGVYKEGAYVASFCGMVPADDPRLVCLVVIDEPSGNYYGSQVAAPVFQSVVSDSLRYLGVEPDAAELSGDDDNSWNEVQVPNVVNLDPESAAMQLQAAGLNLVWEGEGPLVVSQMPYGLSYAYKGDTVTLELGGYVTNEDGTTSVTVPRLLGKRFAESASLLSELGLTLYSTGEGVATAQEPSPGEVVPAGSTVSVYFQKDQSN